MVRLSPKHKRQKIPEKAGVPFPTWFKGEGFSVGYNAYKLPSEGGPGSLLLSYLRMHLLWLILLRLT